MVSRHILIRLLNSSSSKSTWEIPLFIMGLNEKINSRTRSLKSETPFNLKDVKKHKWTSPDRLELKRILSLPIEKSFSFDVKNKFNLETVVADKYEKGFRLFDCQTEALITYLRYGSVFGPIGVGHGKTLICLKIASYAFMHNLRRVLYLMPAHGYDQLVMTDIPWARKHTTIAIPFVGMGKLNKVKRLARAKQQRPGCYLVPYSYLSTQDSVELLDTIAPQLIICDEAHYVKNFTAVRTKRLFSYMKKNEEVRLVALSGTMTDKSLKDYHHTIRKVLGNNCPVPMASMMAMEWAAIIDSGVGVPTESQLNFFTPLREWAKENFKEDFPADREGSRKAFKKRLISAPGVVATEDAPIGTSLVIKNEPVEEYQKSKNWDQLSNLIRDVEQNWITPNGDEISYAVHSFKWLYELSSGFYNSLVWPAPELITERSNLSFVQAKEHLERSQEHHLAVQAYNKELRQFLTYRSRPGCDSPMLVGLEILKNGPKIVGQKLFKLYKLVESLDFEGRIKRDSIQVRVCPFKVDAVVKWAKELKHREGALIWYFNIEMGEWIYEKLRKAHINTLHCPAGANKAILNPKNWDRKIVASMSAHGQVKNLQAFQKVLFAQFPRNVKMAEQTIGRVHRKGQTADEIVVQTMKTMYFDHLVYAACLNDASYVWQTTGGSQKILYATYDPPPPIFDREILNKAGMQIRQLTPDMEERFKDRFGREGNEFEIEEST